MSYYSDGQRWWVYQDLSSASGDLVVPKALHTDVSVPIGGTQFLERHQLIVTGFVYSFVADAAGEGFQLNAVDSDTHRIWAALSQAAGVVQFSVSGIEVMLSPACADTPSSNPAKLTWVKVGTPTSGSLLVCGLHASADGKRAWTGSPISF